MRITELGQTRFSSMHRQTNCVQFILRFIMAPLQRGLSRAYFMYDHDCDGRLRPSPFGEGIGFTVNNQPLAA